MDYFAIREIAKPAPKDNQVLVKVHAVSINDWDWADLERITKGHWLVAGCTILRIRVESDVPTRLEIITI